MASVFLRILSVGTLALSAMAVFLVLAGSMELAASGHWYFAWIPYASIFLVAYLIAWKIDLDNAKRPRAVRLELYD